MSGVKIDTSGPKPVVPSTSRAPRIIQPTKSQLSMYSETRAKLCGGCKSFNHAEGQVRLYKHKQLQAIVLDAGWQVKHLGDAPERMGLCEQGGDMLVGPNAFGCEHFRRK